MATYTNLLSIVVRACSIFERNYVVPRLRLSRPTGLASFRLCQGFDGQVAGQAIHSAMTMPGYHLIFLLSISFLTSSLFCAQFDQYHDFVIMINSYNNAPFCERNILSALDQDYPTDHFRIIFTNDCSTDQTWELTSAVVAAHPKGGIVTMINNSEHKYALRNFYDATHQYCRPDQIIVTLDGDDFLKDQQVLRYLNQVYADPQVWLTYGSYEFFPARPDLTPGARPYTPKTIRAGTFRKAGFRATHLRTYYAGLFHKIRLADFKDRTGAWYLICPDLAIMYPLLEMAGSHSKFIEQVLYIYNVSNPAVIVDYAAVRQVTREIERKPPYARLKHW